MAHAILAAEAEKRGLPIDVYSAGVYDFRGEPAIDDTTKTCAMFETPAPAEVATWARDLPLASIDRFLVMEQHHADVLMSSYGVEPEKISLLGEFDLEDPGTEIADPFSRGRAVYEQSYRQIRECIMRYLEVTYDLPK